MTESLKYGRERDAYSGENEAEADGAECGNTYREHFLVCVKEQKSLRGEYLHYNKPNAHEAGRDNAGDFYGGNNSLFVTRAVVERYNRNNAVVQTEYGHECKALQLEV